MVAPRADTKISEHGNSASIRPTTMASVIAPVPMKPSFMSTLPLTTITLGGLIEREDSNAELSFEAARANLRQAQVNLVCCHTINSEGHASLQDQQQARLYQIPCTFHD